MRTPSHSSACPIHATGCQRMGGSPATRSRQIAKAGMQASSSGQKAASSDPAALTRSHSGQALACSAVRADCQKPEASTEKIQKQNKMTRDAARLFKREIQEASGSGCAIKRKKTAFLADAPEPVQSLARGSEPRMGWPIKAFAMPPQSATSAASLLQPFRRPGMPASDSQSSTGHAFIPLRHRPPGLHPAAATRLPAQPHRWRADPRLKQALQAQRQAASPWLAQPYRGQTPD